MEILSVTPNSLQKAFSQLLAALKEETCKYYKERLISLVIYGSVARGTMRPDSDVDILIIAEDLPRGRMARVREFENIEQALSPVFEKMSFQGIDTYLAPVFKTKEEAISGSPLFLDMVEDAKILYDSEDFFSRRLQRLKERLISLGAKRVWKGNVWYWDLKPDYKPGDVIEL